VRSFITNLSDGATVKAGLQTLIKGIAFDGGYGVSDVVLSTDGGATWASANLGADLGKYSFREFQATVSIPAGEYILKSRAINRLGQSQPDAPCGTQVATCATSSRRSRSLRSEMARDRSCDTTNQRLCSSPALR
jgi:hypothetical protein